MKNYKIILCTIPVLTLLFSTHVFATSQYTHFGRYLTVTDKPQKNDSYKLSGIVQREFPDSVHSIEQALQYTLKGTGYSLLPLEQSTKTVRELYQQKLPSYSRKLGPLPLIDVLEQLSGQAFQLVVDPVHKLISFKLRDSYHGL